MADVEENMEEVAVEQQEEQAVAEDSSASKVETAAQSTTVGGVTMDEGMFYV